MVKFGIILASNVLFQGREIFAGSYFIWKTEPKALYAPDKDASRITDSFWNICCKNLSAATLLLIKDVFSFSLIR